MQVPQTEVLLRGADGVELLRTVLPPGEYVIGRLTACELRVEADLVSRRHARLTINFDHALIEDLGSAHGTKVNGKPVTEATRLWPNQKVQLGSATLEVRRLKAVASADVSLAPSALALRVSLPEEFWREKKYDIGGVVAQGGMGAILNAKEATIERTVAMKVMLDGSSPDDLVRFIAEAKVTGQLEHPGIVPVYELGVDENEQVFYTMKFVQGITLRKVLDLMAGGAEATLRKYPLGALLTIFQKVCDAIAFAHSKGVIHRDLKPENIMLGDFGEVLVMDWGLAKRMRNAELGVGNEAGAGAGSAFRLPQSAFAGTATMTGSIMGTPQYMAPEQARGEVETLDARADIYALGAILYHLLALRPSVLGDDAYAIVERVARGEVESLNDSSSFFSCSSSSADAEEKKMKMKKKTKVVSHLPGGRIPASLAAVVGKAMALDRTARYADVRALQDDLAAFQNGFATSAEKAGAWKHFALFVRRNKAASIGVAAVLAVSIGFTAKVITEGRRAENALVDLRSAAPTLISQARGLIDEQKFDDALAKIEFAVKIDGENADYRLLRGQVLEATLRLGDAAAEFRRVLALGPNDSAAANLALCEKLLRDHQTGGDLDEPGLKALHKLMIKELRTTQDVPIAARLGLGRAATDARIQALFEVWRKLPGWEKMAETERVHYPVDGTIILFLHYLPISDLSVLKGLPISNLSIPWTKVEDLSVLAGHRLVAFNAHDAPISDLEPLRGMLLKSIDLAGCRKLTNLSALAGMPLEYCLLSSTTITDFSPLKGCPIEELNLSESRATTLDAFAGAPCERLSAKGAHALVDISAVRTMRLKFVDFVRATGIADLAPLADCPDLEEARLPGEAKNVAALRRLTKLRSISYGTLERTSPEELWVKLGIADTRDREHLALFQKASAALVACGGSKSDPNWVKVLPDGTLDLQLRYAEYKTLAPLRGLPVSVLDITGSGVTDLAPAADLPLRKLSMSKTRITDLSPLAKCRKLESLVCHQTAVRDLSALAGLPLVVLNVSSTSVSSLAPLAGMPLKELWLERTSVSDLRPLLSCPTLASLVFTKGGRDVGQLRALKKLVRISTYAASGIENPPAQTAEEFWREYDATQAAEKK